MSVRNLGELGVWLARNDEVILKKAFGWTAESFSQAACQASRNSALQPVPLPDLNRWIRYEGSRGWRLWIFKGDVYEITGKSRDSYSGEQCRLLILEYCNREGERFEKLKRLSKPGKTQEGLGQRERIPEQVRIEVWRRDGGKCASCGGREMLEYDHIVPISKGGSNTSRNIELLCEKCNREKGDRIA